MKTNGKPFDFFLPIRASALSALLLTTIPALADDPTIEASVIIATNSVWVNKESPVMGDVVVIDAAVGPVVKPGADEELYVERGGEIYGNLWADSIFLNRGVTVGDVTCNELDDRGAATGAVTCDPGDLVLPVFDQLPTFHGVEIRSGARDITVLSGQTLVIPEAACDDAPVPPDALCGDEFGDVFIEGTGVLEFRGGILSVRSIRGGGGGGGCGTANPDSTTACSAFVFLGPSDVRVEGQIDIGKNSFFGPSESVEGLSAKDIIVHVSGANGPSADDSNPLVPPQAVKSGQDGTFQANVYAPFGTVVMNKNSNVAGSLIARDVWVESGVMVDLDSYYANLPFVNRPPTADPQTVFTDGAASVLITLTGSDPEGGDLTFGVLGDGCPTCTGPGAGTLSGLAQIVPPVVLLEDRDNTVGDDPALIGDGNCDPGEVCSPGPQAPISSAVVTYTPNLPANNEEDNFTFSVMDPGGKFGFATVDINPFDPSPFPSEPVDTVVALDVSAATTVDLAFTLVLQGEAPCEGAGAPDPDRPCDGIGADSPLTFGVAGDGCAACVGPGFGTLGALTQVTPDPVEVEDVAAAGGNDDGTCDPGETCVFINPPQRTATVSYTPDAGFESPPDDSFEFEACGIVDGFQTCDTGTATVSVLPARAVAALPQTIATPLDTSTTITLLAVPGGQGSETEFVSPSRVTKLGSRLQKAPSSTIPISRIQAAFLDPAEVAGGVTDSDGNGAGDIADSLPGPTPELTSARIGGDLVVSIDFNTLPDGSPTPTVAGSNPGECTRFDNDPECVVDDEYTSLGVTFTGSGVRFSPSSAYTPGGGVDGSTMIHDNSGAPFRVVAEFDPPVTSVSADVTGAANSNIRMTAYDGPFLPCQTPPFCPPDPNVVDETISSANNAVLGFKENISVSGNQNIVTVRWEDETNPGSSGVGIDNLEFAIPDANPDAIRRFQMEWDISNLGASPDNLVSATVELTTNKAATDTRHTVFFYGSASQDGNLLASDFEAPVVLDQFQQPVELASMAPAGTVGQDGTFSFDVTEELRNALAADFEFFSVQGRVDDAETGTGSGLQIYTTADGPVNDFKQPQLGITTPGVVAPPVEFRVTTLPLNGTLTDTFGTQITTVPYLLFGSTVTFTPDSQFTGTTSFGFEAFDTFTATTDTSTVTILVLDLFDGDCLLDKLSCDDGRLE